MDGVEGNLLILQSFSGIQLLNRQNFLQFGECCVAEFYLFCHIVFMDLGG